MAEFSEAKKREQSDSSPASHHLSNVSGRSASAPELAASKALSSAVDNQESCRPVASEVKGELRPASQPASRGKESKPANAAAPTSPGAASQRSGSHTSQKPGTPASQALSTVPTSPTSPGSRPLSRAAVEVPKGKKKQKKDQSRNRDCVGRWADEASSKLVGDAHKNKERLLSVSKPMKEWLGEVSFVPEPGLSPQEAAEMQDALDLSNRTYDIERKIHTKIKMDKQKMMVKSNTNIFMSRASEREAKRTSQAILQKAITGE